ncbi:MAG: ABC transporter permease [Clostridia bacterium]|nr:ABC transporter permease [Clostridia bacterium]
MALDSRRGKKRKGKKRKIFSPIYLTLVLVILYLPILMVVIYSFNSGRTIGAWQGFTTGWYTRLFGNALMGDALKNSLILAALSSGLAGAIGTLGAIGLARGHLRGAGALESLATLPMMIPELVLGMAYLAVFTAAGIKLGMGALVATHTAFCVPYVLINVKSRLAGMDPALEEAARDLGARPMRVLRDITLPLIMPSVVSGMMLSAAMSLDDVVISFFVTSAETTTLPLKVYTGLRSGGTPEINALSTLMLGAIFICVALSQLLSARSARNDSTRSNAAENRSS